MTEPRPTESAAYRRSVAADLEATMYAHDSDPYGFCAGVHLGEDDSPPRYPCQARLWAEVALELLLRR